MHQTAFFFSLSLTRTKSMEGFLLHTEQNTVTWNVLKESRASCSRNLIEILYSHPVNEQQRKTVINKFDQFFNLVEHSFHYFSFHQKTKPNQEQQGQPRILFGIVSSIRR